MKELQGKISYTFKNQTLLEQAFNHRSFAHEQRDRNQNLQVDHNERLEFLGDAVLDLVISELLMSHDLLSSEGELSKKRAGLVNETHLCKIAKSLNLGNVLKLGKGELKSGGALKPRLLASCYEALIGALYLDAGYEETKKLIVNQFTEFLDADYLGDFKTRLQEVTQKKLKAAPVYKLECEEGPSHSPRFVVGLYIKDKKISEAEGTSKKIAEQKAAEIALKELL